jgi:hypothetical protein
MLHVAWMSIVLGLVAQGVVIVILRMLPNTLLAEVCGKITWSVIVCSALAIATMAAKAGPMVTPGAARLAVALAGMLAAPAALATARTVQKTVAASVSSAGAPAASVAPGATELAIAKAIQYAIFGWLIMRAQQRGFFAGRVATGSLAAHLCVGVPIGLIFAAYLFWRTFSTTDPANLHLPPLLARAASDAAATTGCSIVLWAAGVLGAGKGK